MRQKMQLTRPTPEQTASVGIPAEMHDYLVDSFFSSNYPETSWVGQKLTWYYDMLQVANVGRNEEVTETLVAIISRIKSDRNKQFRTLAGDEQAMKTQKPTYIPLRSVIYSATNTLNKLAGSYMQVGVVSALVTPSEKVEKLEEILRR
jgi:hypothetical protein